MTSGDRVWWYHTANHLRYGTVQEVGATVGVRVDDSGELLYLNPWQLHRL